MRRQATSGVCPAGSGRALRLDPLTMPIRFDAHDARADGHIRQIELHNERIVLRRSLQGMRMAINVRIRDFLGIARRATHDASMVVLVHRDPSLSIPLLTTDDAAELAHASTLWSRVLALPEIADDTRDECEPKLRRRRRNAVKWRRPGILMRRRVGRPMSMMAVYRGEREIIARN